jgi:hypothetical protein
MDAQRVRWKVYGEEEALLPASMGVGGREIDAHDDRETTTHFLVYAGQEPVGTVRLLEPSAVVERTQGGPLGLELESKFNLGTLSAPGTVPAEVTRYCVLRRYRRTGVTTALLAGLLSESARRGITHWVAGANMETDFAEEAVIADLLVHQKKLVSGRFRAEPHADELPPTLRKRPYYTQEQRLRALQGELAGLKLPSTLSLFATRMSARYIGPPAYDTYFNVFALPLVTTLEDIRAERPSECELIPHSRAGVAAHAIPDL